MARQADDALAKGDVAVALQYNYWAYTLARSLQFPTRAVDDYGEPFINTLPLKIEQILRDIKAEYVSRDGDFVELKLTYKGQPCTVDFTYNDGRHDGCNAQADGGNASIEMAPGYANADAYHLNIEYQYKDWARGDAEMQSVLDAIPMRPFGRDLVVKVNRSDMTNKTNQPSKPNESGNTEDTPVLPGKQTISDVDVYAAHVNKVIDALRTHRYDEATACFTGRGLDNFNRLVRGRKGRLLGEPQITLYRNARGNVLARGLRMSFAVTERGRKTTLVDDVILTFDDDKKISNLTFGIGSIAESDLLNKQVEWGEDVRQQVLDFLENYKTAYCLKDSNFINAIFADDATIIVGHVAKRTTRPGMPESKMSDLGREIITTKQYTKAEYLRNLKRTFRRNQFINIKFTNNDVLLLPKEEGQVFAIQIGQEYSSSTYSDQGFLYLQVDMTQPEEPLIKIRTWQPKPDPEFGIFGAGHFYK